MVHCTECDATIATDEDVEFLDIDSSATFLTSAKRFYVAACADCGAAIGTGVAGAR